MSYKFILTLRQSSGPHLYLDQIKTMIKEDEYLLPAMRGYLNYMKKTKRNWLPLALQSEVIVSPIYFCNLTRGLSPQLTEFNKISWIDTDKERFKNNPEKFLSDIKKLYEKMGYEIKEENIDDKIVKTVIDSFDKKVDKLKNLQSSNK